jgi:Spy/CpxP family protein refolding chaperone
MQLAAIGALAAGMAFAQAASPSTSGNPPAGAHRAAPNRARQHLDDIAQKLNLSDAQRQQFHTIFREARQSAMPIREELRANRQALAAAVKTDKTGEIQQLATTRGKLMGQMTAIYSEARAKFYQTLTPEQRAKADQMHHEFRQQMRDRWSERKNG